MLPVYVVYCARIANPDINWTQESVTERFGTWLAGLAAQLRMDGKTTLVLLDRGYLSKDLDKSLLSAFGLDPRFPRPERYNDLLTALEAVLATVGRTQPLGRKPRMWGRITREGEVTTLHTWPLPTDSWATEREVAVTVTSEPNS